MRNTDLRMQCHQGIGRHIRIALVASSLSLLSCGEDFFPRSVQPAMVYDSVGIEIVLSRRPLWTEDSAWALERAPAFAIGPEVGPDRFLHRVGRIERLGDGRLVVENRGAVELLVFDSTGLFLGVWGGPGEGPGEFTRLRGIYGCDDGRLVVFESPRLTYFDAGGGFEGVEILDRSVFTEGTLTIRGVREDCRAILFTRFMDGLVPTQYGSHQQPMLAFWAVVGEPTIDTVDVFPGYERVVDGSGRSRGVVPFAYTPHWATDGTRIYYGWGGHPQIHVMSADGSPSRIIRWDAPSPPITPADWESYEEDRSRRIARDPANAGARLDRGEHPHPTRKPFFGQSRDGTSAFHLSRDGHLWVRQHTRWVAREGSELTPPVRWWIFDDRGRWLGEVETPERFEVKNIRGDLVLGVWTDELNVEEVRAYRIVGREN